MVMGASGTEEQTAFRIVARWHGTCHPGMSCALRRRVSVTPELVQLSRRMPVGAEVSAAHGAHFRVWAPKHRKVTLIVEDETGSALGEVPLRSESGGYFSLLEPTARAGTLYRFRLGDRADRFPDPVSRFQP